MKIIKHGDTWGEEFTCPACGCVFKALPGEYKTQDIIHSGNLLDPPRLETRYSCACPECGAECKK